MSVTLPTRGPSESDEVTPAGTEQLTPVAASPVAPVAPVASLAERRGSALRPGRRAGTRGGDLTETGAASAEYAAVTACGVGLAGVLMKLLSSDFGQNLLESVLKFFLGMVGIG